jgi:hypothetical protein
MALHRAWVTTRRRQSVGIGTGHSSATAASRWTTHARQHEVWVLPKDHIILLVSALLWCAGCRSRTVAWRRTPVGVDTTLTYRCEVAGIGHGGRKCTLHILIRGVPLQRSSLMIATHVQTIGCWVAYGWDLGTRGQSCWNRSAHHRRLIRSSEARINVFVVRLRTSASVTRCCRGCLDRRERRCRVHLSCRGGSVSGNRRCVPANSWLHVCSVFKVRIYSIGRQL